MELFDDDEPGDDPWDDNSGWGCVLGDKCCCPHIDHHSSECFSVEDAEGLEGREGKAAS